MEYDNRTDGSAPPDVILKRITTPEILRARAAIRLEIAKQDRMYGESDAYLRNLRVATDMEKRSRQ